MGQILEGGFSAGPFRGEGRLRIWSLTNVRNPLWRALGIGTLISVCLASVYLAYLRPGPLSPGGTMVSVSQGKKGNYIELLGNGRFSINYERFQGDKGMFLVEGIQATLEEPAIHWHMQSPKGTRKDEAWTLDGPMGIQAKDVASGRIKGKGTILASGPALGWDKGLWQGLAPLSWEDLEEGPAKGVWHLPAGWRRELDGRFVVTNGPVSWQSSSQDGQVKSMKAQKIWTVLGLNQGRMEGVEAELTDGRITAGAAEVDSRKVDWFAPITLQRHDGWVGEAEHGIVFKPSEGKPVEVVELKSFRAKRPSVTGERQPGAQKEMQEERILADGVRWTPAGLRLEGGVVWDQPKNGSHLVLKSQRVLIRESAGSGLPDELPVGEAWAEGFPVISWDKKSLSCPRMEVRRLDGTWRLQSPVYGKSEQGTFSSGAGHGTREKWEFEGPVKAAMHGAGSLRGDRMLWDEDVWTVVGRPATMTGTRGRLSGDTITGKGDLVLFPNGLSGAFRTVDGDLVLRADRGDYREKSGIARLQGRVECKGRPWKLNADDIQVEMGPGRTVKRMLAKGSVALAGLMGEGWGESLELDLTDMAAPKARWHGKVRGVADVKRE